MYTIIKNRMLNTILSIKQETLLYRYVCVK